MFKNLFIRIVELKTVDAYIFQSLDFRKKFKNEIFLLCLKVNNLLRIITSLY